jgi:hypothetical protein
MTAERIRRVECFKQSRLNRRPLLLAACPLLLAAGQGFSSTAWQLSRIWLGLRGAFPNQLMQDSIQWMLRICAIEPLITVAAANDQIRRLKFGHLILNRSQCEKTAPRQLARIQLLAAVCEQQSQHLGAHDRK